MVEVVKFESAQSKFVHEWSRGFHENNLDTIVKPLHKDFRYALYPRSLGAPEQNREQFTECMKQMVGAGFVCYDSVYHSLVEVPGKVIVHHTFKSKGPSGVETVHEAIYTTEVVTDEDGSFKIKRAEEFADSKVHVESRQAAAAAKPNA